jgi:hypothetical protein
MHAKAPGAADLGNPAAGPGAGAVNEAGGDGVVSNAPTAESTGGSVDEDSIFAPRFGPLREALSETKKRETLLKIEAQVEAFLADPK